MRTRTESLPKGGPTWGGKMHRNSVPGEAVSWGKNRKTIFRGTEILKGKILPLNSNTQNTRNHGGSGGCPPGGGLGAEPPVYGGQLFGQKLKTLKEIAFLRPQKIGAGRIEPNHHPQKKRKKVRKLIAGRAPSVLRKTLCKTHFRSVSRFVCTFSNFLCRLARALLSDVQKNKRH